MHIQTAMLNTLKTLNTYSGEIRTLKIEITVSVRLKTINSLNNWNDSKDLITRELEERMKEIDISSQIKQLTNTKENNVDCWNMLKERGY